MLLHAEIDSKVMGDKLLLAGLNIRVEDGEKVGLVGRNGVGKTTLFGILAGSDGEFDGHLEIKHGARIVATAQEHHNLGAITAVDYILSSLPGYAELKQVIDTHPEHMGENMRKISQYTDALQRFSEAGYYHIEDQIIRTLGDYQIDEDRAQAPMADLSGGQKRLVELVRVQYSDPDLALIDEPTNHMDYVAKDTFMEWLKAAKHACLVITHDRDVLGNVDRIIEIKDGISVSYKGGYDAYLKQNAHKTTNQMQGYEIAQKTIIRLKEQIEYAKAKAPSSQGKGKNPWIVMRDRLQKELDKTIAENPKPSFWIDQESVEALNPKMTGSYHKYKAKNIKLGSTGQAERESRLLDINDVQVGYDNKSLFAAVSFNLSHGDRLHIVGRNGAGKTTLVKAIEATYRGEKAKTLLHGSIEPGRGLRLAVYEQEVSDSLLDLTLFEALERVFEENGLPVNPQAIMRAMGDYLFKPESDGRLLVSQLSGGQKARLQIISLLIGKPNLLILDEPTNHLDLPSIEELENALTAYHGAIIFISHDSYFAKNIGGEEIILSPNL
jgi:ATP-binding cassette subfamily F protein 3